MNAAPKVTVLPPPSKTPVDIWQPDSDKTPIRILPRSEDIQVTGEISSYRVDLTAYTSSESKQSRNVDNSNDERELVRKKLLEAGFLVTSILTPDDDGNSILSSEEMAILGKLPPDALTIQQILDEDRGEY